MWVAPQGRQAVPPPADPDRVGVVDAAIAPMLATEAAGRIHRGRRGQGHRGRPRAASDNGSPDERARRYVALSRTDEAGLRTVIARISAGDAVWVDTTVSRVAEILTAQHPDLTRDQARAKAFGWLARPADLLRLLLEHTEQTSVRRQRRDGAEWCGRVPCGPARRVACRRLVVPGAEDQPVRPSARGGPAGSPRGGPRRAGSARSRWSTSPSCSPGTQITVKPVIDLTDRIRLTAYEHPVR